jgi:hypothetical protein
MPEPIPLRILMYQRPWGRPDTPEAAGCEFSYDRSRWQEADAVVFHIPQLSKDRFPPRKLESQFWVGCCLESEINYPILARRAELGAVFDLWMTYQQASDVWCPYFDTQVIESLQTAPAAKTAANPAAALVSSSFDSSGRTALLEALIREMPVDSYGTVFRNQQQHIERVRRPNSP